MAEGSKNHSTIVAQSVETLWNNGDRITITTECRADGCVTWSGVRA